MDPMYPCSQNSSYMGLLQNVQNNNVQENFPYESFPSSVDIGTSEISPFSSQQSEPHPNLRTHLWSEKILRTIRPLWRGRWKNSTRRRNCRSWRYWILY
uniref:Uncharacterized protein n=1 Tax=Brassica oleracea TaxID=3712 RepID=A0A3P6H029_BRAOL|nr:unnamed protein product [Brassica oleracea]